VNFQVEDFNAFTAPLAELGDALPLEVRKGKDMSWVVTEDFLEHPKHGGSRANHGDIYIYTYTFTHIYKYMYIYIHMYVYRVHYITAIQIATHLSRSRFFARNSSMTSSAWWRRIQSTRPGDFFLPKTWGRMGVVSDISNYPKIGPYRLYPRTPGIHKKDPLLIFCFTNKGCQVPCWIISETYFPHVLQCFEP